MRMISIEEHNSCKKLNNTSRKKVDILCVCLTMLLYMLNNRVIMPITSGWIGYISRCYFNDLISQIVFLGFSSLVLAWAGIRLDTYTKCISLGMIAGIVWECIIPLVDKKSVGDMIDMVCYFLGVNMYYLIIKFGGLYNGDIDTHDATVHGYKKSI